MKENTPGGTGVLKRFSDKPKAKMVRQHGTENPFHRKDGQQGTPDKEGKVHYADLGEKYGEPKMASKEEKHYPSIHVHGDQLPELANHKVGDEVEMHVKAHLKSSEQRDDGKHHFHLEVKKAAIKGKGD